MISPEIDMSAVQRIVIPGGRDYERCLEAFETQFGITAPRFDDRLLTRKADGITYIKVKGKDIPAYVANGLADIGLTGTDVCEEQMPGPEDSNLFYQAIGEPMCTFNVLLPANKMGELTARLTNLETKPVRAVTSYPRFLLRCIQRAKAAGRPLNLTLEQFKPSGSVEALPGWITEAAVDIVETGETAVANGLDIGPKLADIYPAVVWRGVW